MRKRYVQDSSRWLLNAAVLAGLLALLLLSVATLPRIRSVPQSATIADNLSTPTRAAQTQTQAQALATITSIATQIVSDAPIATSVPPLAGAIEANATATPFPMAVAVAPDETQQPVEFLPEPDPVAAEPTGVIVAPPTPEAAPTRVIVVPPPTQVIADPAPTKAIVRPVPTKTRDPNLLPNGVRYGDHKPNLPGRIVRVASPNVQLDASVYEVYVKKNAWEVAEYAAGHHYNSLNPGEGGNIVLNGHNNWKGEVFRYLENSKVGDIIQVWTQAGKEYDYQVTEIKKLKEAGVSMAQRLKNAEVMNPTNHEQLTLITCWPYTTFTHRLIIIATPVK